METSARLVLDVGLVLLLAAAAGWAARQVGLPAIVGYLAAGLAVSPFTPGYVADRDQITFLADVGVVLLLFEVGIEVDLVRFPEESHNLSRSGRPDRRIERLERLVGWFDAHLP